MLKIGIFGGTFNPPHKGHVESATNAVNQLNLDSLLVMPTAFPPHKPLPDNTPDAEKRLCLTRLAFENEPKVTVSDLEIKSNKICYTIDTVTAVKKSNPTAQIFLLVGTDSYLSLEQWKSCAELLKAVTLVVFPRGKGEEQKIIEYSEVLKKLFNVNTKIIDNNIIDISSSELRDLLPQRKGAEYLAKNVYSCIIKYRMYNAKPDWGFLREVAHSMLDEKRIPHVVGCESEAVRLAKHWGLDEDEAREAAILHDITKKLNADEHYKVLSSNSILFEKTSKAEEKLLHSKTAAVLASAEFGSSNAVYNAILLHTTGKAGMKDLDKIIYLADYIEPNRDFEGVDELRRLSYENLNDAMKMGLQMAVTDLEERGITPNKITYEALESFTR
jgi:nicotinate-nucleotide adenylyltransferase